MKRILILLSVCLISLSGIAQKQDKYSENDLKQFYRTIQGDYTGELRDSTKITLHFTPIWEYDRFQWLYLEAANEKTGAIVTQKIIELKPISDISFNVVVYDLSHPEMFAGKWSNRNFFDGFNTKILKRHRTFVFLKTKDFEYQTGWNRRKNFKCFPSGDRIHFKFVQEDERLYVKRVPRQSSSIIGTTFYKALTD